MYEYNARVTRVVDGDTVDCEIDLGFFVSTRQRIRLAHIDAPERGQQGHDNARIALEALVIGKALRLRTEKTSKWGYWLGELYDGQTAIYQAMLDTGLVRPYEGGAK